MAIATLSVLHGYRETGITWALHKQEVRLHYCCVRVLDFEDVIGTPRCIALRGRNLTLMHYRSKTLYWSWRICLR